MNDDNMKKFHLRNTKKCTKYTRIFSRKSSYIILIIIILLVLSSVSYASDAAGKFTFMGDDGAATSYNDIQQDEQVESEENIDNETLQTNTTAEIIECTSDHVIVEINVTDINNNSVNNGTITIKEHDDIIVENLEIENGTVLIELSVTPGDYEVLIIYNPTDEYSGSQVTLSFNVKDDYMNTLNQSDSRDTYQKSDSSNDLSSDSSPTSNYIGNSHTGKFHSRLCREVDKMDEGNKVPLNSREDAISSGYKPCKKCKP